MWKVAVEEAQGAGRQRETHGEHEEVEPCWIESGTGQGWVPIAETELQEHVLPLHVEEHQALDVDEDGVPGWIDQDVVGPEFAVDQPVFRARRHPYGQFPQAIVQGGRDRSDPGVAFGRLREIPRARSSTSC